MRAPITFCISDCGDPRLARALNAIERDGMKQDQVLVERSGTIPHSKNIMLKKTVGWFVVYICADQEPPEGWLERLIAPIVEGKADYTCGPTKLHPNPYYASKYDQYLAECEDRNYANCAYDQTGYPMCNTAWKKSLLDDIAVGDCVFDERFAVAADDIDVNIRATAAGYRGVFVPGAWVWHDQSHLNTLWKVVRRRLIYERDMRFCVWLNRDFLRAWTPRKTDRREKWFAIDNLWRVLDFIHKMRGEHEHPGEDEVRGTASRGTFGGLF